MNIIITTIGAGYVGLGTGARLPNGMAQAVSLHVVQK